MQAGALRGDAPSGTGRSSKSETCQRLCLRHSACINPVEDFEGAKQIQNIPLFLRVRFSDILIFKSKEKMKFLKAGLFYLVYEEEVSKKV